MSDFTNTIKAPKDHFGTDEVLSEAKKEVKAEVEEICSRLDEALNFGPEPSDWDAAKGPWPGLSKDELAKEFEDGIYVYRFYHDPDGDPGDMIAVYCVAASVDSVPAASTKKLKRHEVRTWHPHHGEVNV